MGDEWQLVIGAVVDGEKQLLMICVDWRGGGCCCIVLACQQGEAVAEMRLLIGGLFFAT